MYTINRLPNGTFLIKVSTEPGFKGVVAGDKFKYKAKTYKAKQVTSYNLKDGLHYCVEEWVEASL